ncbi:MAG: cell wall hydrolase [Rhodospirillaceae bacterium]
MRALKLLGMLLAAIVIAAPPAAAAGLSPEMRCLALTVYWEARSKATEGQLAVAHVVLNRVAAGEFPDTICGVVRQGGERPLHRCQFSWWCDGRSDSPTNAAAWGKSVSVAREALSAGAPDPTGGALYFHTDAVAPGWAADKTRLVRIGQHLFYR